MMGKEEREQEGVRSRQAWNAFSAAAEDKIGGGHVELFCSCTDQHRRQVCNGQPLPQEIKAQAVLRFNPGPAWFSSL